MRILSAILFFAAATAVAQPPPPELQPIPDSPPDLQEPGTLEPEVTIRRTDQETIEEYRANGRLYMIRVTPKQGIPYVLVDADGDGSLETQSSDLDPDVMVPGWIILQWK